MTFHHFIRRYTRVVMIFIVIVMVIPLVLWGSLGPTGEAADSEEDAGIIFGDVHVSKGEFRRHRYRAVADFWLEVYTRRRREQEPTDKVLNELTWDRIILLQDAKEKGVHASETEYRDLVWNLYRFGVQMQRRQAPVRRQEFNEQIFDMIGRTVFRLQPRAFREWVREQATVQKLQGLVAEGAFADYSRVYEEVVRQNRMAKAAFAGFDPQEFVRSLTPVRPAEIAAYYERNKTRYQIPDRVRISYLMADYESLKGGLPEPTDGEVRKYYDDNQAEFLEEHEHEEGEVHREDEEPPQVRPFAEVREQAADRVKTRKAEAKASEIMRDVNRALGEMVDAGTGGVPDDAFEKLKEKFAAQDVTLTLAETPLFDLASLEGIEETVGDNSNLDVWAFAADRGTGDVSGSPVTTSKAVALFRVADKKASQEAALTAPIRSRIRKALREDRLRNLASAAANRTVGEINARGFAMGKGDAEWTTTKYFAVRSGRPEMEDWQLASAISQEVAGGRLQAGKATRIAGSRLRDPERADWSYALYLADVAPGESQDFESDFDSALSRLNNQERSLAIDRYGRQLRAMADLKDFMGKVPAGKPEAPSP